MNALNRITPLLVFVLAGCLESPSEKISIGDGFYMVPKGESAEMHPATVELVLESHGIFKVIWPALTAGVGGPFTLDGGVLFCAKDETDAVALFVSNKYGLVSNVMPSLFSNRVELRQLSSAGGNMRISFWDDAGVAREISVTKEELLALATMLPKNGTQVKWGATIYFEERKK